MRSGLRGRDVSGHPYSSPTSTLRRPGRQNECESAGRRASEVLLFRSSDLIARACPRVVRPQRSLHSINGVKQKRHGRSFLNVLINKEHKGHIFRDFSNTSTEFKNIRCQLRGLYEELISFTDLGQYIFFKINHLFFTTAYKIHLEFVIIFGYYI